MVLWFYVAKETLKLIFGIIDQQLKKYFGLLLVYIS